MSTRNPYLKGFKKHRVLDPRLQVIPSEETRREWWGGFRQRWANCDKCPLSGFRSKVVQFRGIIPAAVLFIGEAPGNTEDAEGIPFRGLAGKKLDELMEKAGCYDGLYCIINTVGCLPATVNEMGMCTGSVRPPEKDEIKACRPRVVELIEHIQPKLIVLLGKIAASVAPTINAAIAEPIPVIQLVHPSAILRNLDSSPQKAMVDTQRFILTLRTKLNEMGLV